jgi:protein-tyrosine phosphatase
MPLSSIRLQHVLFFVPYANIAWTGGYLLAQATDNIAATMLGFQMVSFLFLYLIGSMGNHYVKVYCMMANIAYIAIFILYLSHSIINSNSSTLEILYYFRVPQLMVLWWIPQIGNIMYALALPSISEIIPGKLYLGNAVAATTPGLLDEFQITHVLELHGSQRSKNDRQKVKAELLQLHCGDFLWSQDSLVSIAPQALQFMDKILLSSEKENGCLLVHCAAGGSRSPAVVVLWLVHSGKEQLVTDAIRTVRKTRPFVDISSDHVGALEKKFHMSATEIRKAA